MQPPLSPIQTSKNHGRDVTNPAPSSAPVLPTSPPGNANLAVSAALQGATLAFNKQKKVVEGNNDGGSPSPPIISNQTISTHDNSSSSDSGLTVGPASPVPRNGLRRDNGALLAATQAAREHAVSRPRAAVEPANASVSRQSTGPSGAGNGSLHGPGTSSRPASGGGQSHNNLVAHRLSELHASRNGNTLLSRPVGRSAVDSTRQGTTSPSLIAATLAASRPISPVRGLSPEPNQGGGKVTHRKGPSVGAANIMPGSAGLGTNRGKRMDETEAPDTASIPPTTSLVSLFEKKREKDTVDPVKRRVQPPELRDPGADRQAGMDKAQQPQMVKPKPKPTPKPKPRSTTEIGTLGQSEKRDELPHSMNPLEYARGNDSGDDQDHLLIADSSPQTHGESQRPVEQPKPQANKRPPTPLSSVFARVSSNHISTQPKKLTQTPPLEPPIPPVRRSSTNKMVEPTAQATHVESKSPEIDAFHMLEQEAAPPRRSSYSSASSNDTFVSASSMQSRSISVAKGPNRPLGRPTPPARSSSLRSISIPDLQRTRAPHAPTPNLNLNSLTNAIVASNLASARLTPSQPPPVPAPRRTGRSPGSHSPIKSQRTADSLRSQLTGGGGRHTQQPLPKKTGMLLPTLRGPQQSLSDDEDTRRRRAQQRHHHHHRRVVGGRKHAHHEGARRRWRDEITPRERRRYEAVWASNRGLFLRKGWAVPYQHLPPPSSERHHNQGIASSGGGGAGGEGRRESERMQMQMQMQRVVDASRAVDGTPEADLVVNVVVRDIWSRSRLPADELAEMWELVDRQRRGALGKEEFVVGMWLIDQRLRGRKIPTRVSQSVWDSAGGGHVAMMQFHLSKLDSLSLWQVLLVSSLGALSFALIILYWALFPPLYDRREAREPPAIWVSGWEFKFARMPICTLPKLAGKRYVLNSPALISAAMRCPTLSADAGVALVSKNGLGASDAEMERLRDPKYIEALRKVVCTAMSGEPWRRVAGAALREIAEDTNQLGLGGGICEVPHAGDWLQDVLSRATMTALYGRRNFTRAERIHDVWLFHNHISVLVMNLAPRLLAPQSVAALSRIQAALKEYYEARYDEGPDVSAFVKNRAALKRQIGATSSDLAWGEAEIPWAPLETRSIHLWWMFLHVFARLDYTERVRQEAVEAVRIDGDSAIVDVVKLSKQPFINACVHVVQHLYNNTYLLKKGADVQWLNGVRHLDEDVWGPDPDAFDPEKFMDLGPNDEKKQRGSIMRRQAYLPWPKVRRDQHQMYSQQHGSKVRR
ncbi:hypothetical protein N657DRAFT_671896 [Parathielavia appendiculata]|uniref:EH domain-containing protein n=1 Tax=Parathielavia appendiculata TaxID=2587402 RepID=A0AAN6U065_9PEZI|nr:hypothetical protein N657DRAFT_671896 [Parathielavia appendiculata]